MVKIDTLLKEKKVSKIKDLEFERYLNFLQSSYLDNLKHSKFNLEGFPRWSIISGYYAMHDMTKLLIAKKFRIKIDFNVHANTILVLKELIQNKELSELLENAYVEFLSLASDLEEAKINRIKVQYYTGSIYSQERYSKEASEFLKSVTIYLDKSVTIYLDKSVTIYLDKIGGLLK